MLGMGDKVNSATEKPLGAGSFAFMPAGMRHFVRAQGETIVQLHGTGPWGYLRQSVRRPAKKATLSGFMQG